MNFRIVSRYVGICTLIIGASMMLSAPWAFPVCGQAEVIESRGLTALIGSTLIAAIFGGLLLWFGHGTQEPLLRKESLAVVGLSWIAATLLGALPLLLSGSCGDASDLSSAPRAVVDALFESASGFTGTGATIYQDLEDPARLPRCILFWRQETHFLGGLGIMVLFVAILGHGAPGKMLMRTEMTGPILSGVGQRMRHTAWAFALIYLGMNAVLTVLLLVQGMSVYDALSHSFATVATGGFSTYNDSLAHFNHAGIEATVTFFMVAACTNFMLLFACLRLRLRDLLRDVEFRAYLAILTLSTAGVTALCLSNGDYDSPAEALRYASFQTVSIQTNTGLVTADFDTWHETARCLLFVLMFVGGCAGSTSCSIKVIRYVLLAKILGLELERSYRPNVVRQLRLAGEPLHTDTVERNVPLYFALFALAFTVCWTALLITEPDSNWPPGASDASKTGEGKILDCASAVAACINGVGPGFGLVGPTSNYASLTGAGKIVLIVAMLLGRLELFAILCLFVPPFWRRF